MNRKPHLLSWLRQLNTAWPGMVSSKSALLSKANLTGSRAVRVVIITVLLIYLATLLEWLFFFTKPSFLSSLSLRDSLAVLFVAPLPALSVSLVILTPLSVFSARLWSKILVRLVPALVLATTLFMFVDKFTHTVLGFYVGSAVGVQRSIYAAVFLALLAWAYRNIGVWSGSTLWERFPSALLIVTLVLTATSTAFALSKRLDPFIGMDEELTTELDRYPSILILSTDGLSASHMSAYGYQRPTTPFIETLLADSLVSENSFTNCGNTTGSVGALLTGKLPTKTRVVYAPSIFSGIHSYQHLPGILRRHGYRNIDISIPNVADSYDLNLRDGFDVVNSRVLREETSRSLLPKPLRAAFAFESYFAGRILDRIVVRLKHIFFLKALVDPFKALVEVGAKSTSDAERVAQLIQFIGESPAPFFAHVHFSGTHGPTFQPTHRVYSKDMEQPEAWMTEFFDDAILDYDGLVQEVLTYLQETGRYEETVIILTADHGQAWASYARVPLIIRFPGGAHKGRIIENTQRADIPPTILDFIGIPIPQWIDGVSLIAGGLDRLRPIITTKNAANYLNESRRRWLVKDFGPPFYALGSVALIECQRWSNLNLSLKQVHTMTIAGHTDPCSSGELKTGGQARDFLIRHLQESGYEISSLSEN